MAKKEVDSNYIKSYSNYIIGILSIVFAFVSSSGIGGIVLGVIGLVRIGKQKDEISRKAKALNLIGLIAGLVIFILYLVFTLTQIDWGALQY